MLTNRRVICWPCWWVNLAHDMFSVTGTVLTKPAQIKDKINVYIEELSNRNDICMSWPTYWPKTVRLEWVIQNCKDEKQLEYVILQEKFDKLRSAMTLDPNPWCATPFTLKFNDYSDNDYVTKWMEQCDTWECLKIPHPNQNYWKTYTAFWYPTNFECELDTKYCCVYFKADFVLFPYFQWDCHEEKCVTYPFCGNVAKRTLSRDKTSKNFKKQTIHWKECRPSRDEVLLYDTLKENGIECVLNNDGKWKSKVHIKVEWEVTDLYIKNLSNGDSVNIQWTHTDIEILPNENWYTAYSNGNNIKSFIDRGSYITLDWWDNKLLVTGIWWAEVCFERFDTYV